MNAARMKTGMKTGVSIDTGIPTRRRSVQLKTILTTGNVLLEYKLSGWIRPHRTATTTGTETSKQVGQITDRLSLLRLARALNPNSVYGDDAEELRPQVHAGPLR